jgi:hypothetical protein
MTTELIVGQTIENLEENKIRVEEVLADSGYGAAQSYIYLEREEITAYIASLGGNKPQRDGFTYNREEDCYFCKEGIKLSLREIKHRKNENSPRKVYRSNAKDCKNCSCKTQCCKGTSYVLEDSYYKPYYDAAYARINTNKGKQKMRLRSSTVEPVWGTLLNFMKMKKVYTKGNKLAHKQLLMAAAAYNIKKLMKFNYHKSIAKEAKCMVDNVRPYFGRFNSGILDDIIVFLRMITGIFDFCQI